MSMRVNTIITHLRAEDAYTLIELLDQLRDELARTYGPEIAAMMQQAQAMGEPDGTMDTDVPF